MKALIAFIVMAVVILTLIEINERIKAKKKKEDCPKEQSDSSSACADCSLLDICEKRPTANG
jgi:large-conductance mechanosensitive channel